MSRTTLRTSETCYSALELRLRSKRRVRFAFRRHLVRLLADNGLSQNLYKWTKHSDGKTNFDILYTKYGSY